MDATPVDLARHVAEWFPELCGRALAVSEAEITAENIPTLPLAMIALKDDAVTAWPTRTNTPPVIADTYVLQMWFKPVRYRRGDGSESPFWAFFNYEPIRARLIKGLLGYMSPAGHRVSYVGLDIEADQFATSLIFTLRHEWTWCEPEHDSADVLCDAGAYKIALTIERAP